MFAGGAYSIIVDVDNIMKLLSFLLAAFAAVGAFAAPTTLVLENDALRAEVVPEWGGRLMFLGRPGGKNALWTNPAAAANTVDEKGKEVWKNVGGEKTWVGGMGLWKGFANKTDAKAWPPPAWFDSAPLEVVRANATNILLRSAAHTSGDWTVALEREFTLAEDGLKVREKLLDGTMEKQTDLFAANAAHEDANAVRREQIRVLDKTPYPDDPRRVWSVTQIPFVDNVAVRLVGAGRTKYFCGCPEISAKDDNDWSRLDLSVAPKNSRVALDGDALAAEIPGVGRLVIEQSADARHIGSFVDPSRAIVYTTGKDIAPSKWTGGKASPYIELEFVALGPDAEQRLTFKIVELTECKIQTDLLTTNVVRGTVSRVSDEQIRVSISESLREAKLNRMREDKLGMFIHWGVYSILGNPTGEWTMYKDRIPKEKYDKLADEFCPPASFSPREWVKLAKRAGCRYAVLTTRHHDGFCLFDTKTTDFNSVKTAAKRDFVREFAEACRAEGLRVGFYFSIMNWQFDHSPNGVFDKKVWDEQVRTTHEALRELMTNYGKVDYLWYDGCSAPGSTDAENMEKMWRIAEMNAMVRRLQPDILVNDRSSSPEDYSTPEQCLTPPRRGRMWESCITCNRSWGYDKIDHDWKSAETLVRSLLHCARFGGNILINIGPLADGSVPEECVKAFEGLGAYVAKYPDSIYGAERDDWTEATHEAGVVTKANGSYWLHTVECFSRKEHKEEVATNATPNSPSHPLTHSQLSTCSTRLKIPRLDGAETIECVAPGIYRVSFKKGAKPCNWLGGRHDVEVKAGDAPVLGDDTGREAPPVGEVEIVKICKCENVANANVVNGQLKFDFPAGGLWRVEIGYVNAEGFKDTYVAEYEAEAGETKTFALPAGAKGVYAKRLSPLWKVVSPKSWEVAGVFKSRYYETRFDEKAIDEVFARDLPKEAKAAKFVPVGVENDKADKSDVRVNLNYSAREKGIGYAFARRNFKSDIDKTVYAAFGADWWGEVYVNGEKALAVRSGWKPTPFPLRIRKGDNEVLVVTHGGSRQHWFALYTNDRN